MAVKIIVTRRDHDYHACLEGNPEIWGCGANTYEALGNLTLAHQDRLRVEIVTYTTDTVR